LNQIKSIIVIAGPTAVGKTAMSIAVAKKLNCPVISADSRQFFKEMNIGTAKPSAIEMQGVEHFFIDSHSITEDYNVGKYEVDVISLLEKIFQTYNQVILVGGSGLYVDAVCKGFDNLPEADLETRNKINTLLKLKGIEGLQELLKELDPVYYNQVDINNPQRMSRALEVCITSGKTFSELRSGRLTKRNFSTIKIGLNTSRELLYSRINNRVDDMLKNGLLEEVKSLIPYKHFNALQTVGYKELFAYLENITDFNTAVELLKQNTRRFAKRQLTWFRRDDEMRWFDPNEQEAIFEFIDVRLKQNFKKPL
jgi:tRNA dimethylallyltransferase